MGPRIDLCGCSTQTEMRLIWFLWLCLYGLTAIVLSGQDCKPSKWKSNNADYLDSRKKPKTIERPKKSEEKPIPERFDYSAVNGLSLEMSEKLQRVRPQTLGQTSRIPGVTPAAVSLISVYIEIQSRNLSRCR